MCIPSARSSAAVRALGIIRNNFAARMFEHGGYAHSPDTVLISDSRVLKLKLCERLKAFSADLCD